MTVLLYIEVFRKRGRQTLQPRVVTYTPAIPLTHNLISYNELKIYDKVVSDSWILSFA